MDYQLSYKKVITKAIFIDLSISLLISIILIINSFSTFVSEKYYLLPFISAFAALLSSFGIVYKDRNGSNLDKLISSIVLIIFCIFCFLGIIITLNDIKAIYSTIILKAPLSAFLVMFLPGNKIEIKTKKKIVDKINPQKKITDDIYYY